MNKCSKRPIVLSIFAASPVAGSRAAPAAEPSPGATPVLRERFTADPTLLDRGDRSTFMWVGR